MFSMMTFNLRLDTMEDGENRWDKRKHMIVDIVKERKPIVVGIQEGLHHMLTYLQEALPHYAQLGSGREGGQYGEYNAILYDKHVFTCIRQGQFWLSKSRDQANSVSWGSACPRICTWAMFAWKDSPERKVTVFNTHLDHASQLARINGVKVIGEEIRKTNNLSVDPVILMGDMNVSRQDEVIQYIRSNGFQEAVDDLDEVSFHGFSSDRREWEQIDYLFYSDSLKMETVYLDKRKENGRYPSDHFPIIGIFSFRPVV